MTKKLYSRRDVEQLSQFYVDHVMAMTSERLHSKSDIAAQLAYRDMVLARRKKEVNDLNDRVHELEGMLRKKLDLIKCGVAANYGSGAYEHELYIEAKEVAYKE